MGDRWCDAWMGLRLVLIVSIAAALLTSVVAAPRGQTPRPADEIPMSRLRADAVLSVALGPGAIATSDGVAMSTDQGIVRVAAATSTPTVVALIGLRPCASLVAAFAALWAPLCDLQRIARVDEKTAGIGEPIDLVIADPSGRIAAGVGSLWVASDASGVVSRVDPDTRQIVAEVRVAAEPSSVAFDTDTVWVTSARGNVLTRVNAHTNEVVKTVTVGPRPGRLAVGEGAVWVLNRGDGSLTRVDQTTTKVETTIAVGAQVAEGDIAVGEGSVWISAPRVPLVRVDPGTNRVVQRFTGDGGGAVLVAHGSLWVALSASTTWRLDPKLVAAMRP